MKATNQHIIRKQTLNLACKGKQDGFVLQKEITDWYYNDLFPELQTIVDELAPDNIYIQLEKINVNVSIKKTAEWKHFLRKQVMEEITVQLRKKINYSPEITGNFPALDPEQHFFKLLKYYLQYGFLPWWSTIKTKTEFEDELNQWLLPQNLQHHQDEIKQFFKDAQSRQRIIAQFTDQNFDTLIGLMTSASFMQHYRVLQKDAQAMVTLLSPSEKVAVDVLLKGAIAENIAGDDNNIQFAARLFIDGLLTSYSDRLKSISAKNISSAELKEIIFPKRKTKNIFEQHISMQQKREDSFEIDTKQKEVNALPVDSANILMPGKSEIQYTGDKKTETKRTGSLSAEELKEGMLVQNAGLVIVAAFLPAILKKLNWYNESGIAKPDQALYLLHYLATGNDNAAEFELILPKVLCGLPVEYVVKEISMLHEEQKNEANELLASVIEYWTVLGNTSIDGLRESFLKRNGKLSYNGKEWLLQTEQQPYDMLLQHLPWNISMIQLPWMKQMLKTEWIY